MTQREKHLREAAALVCGFCREGADRDRAPMGSPATRYGHIAGSRGDMRGRCQASAIWTALEER